ncbi:hypothetical protein ACT3N0_12705 [Citrobacter portucalensis]
MNTLTFLFLSGALIAGVAAILGGLAWRISSRGNAPRYEEHNYD